VGAKVVFFDSKPNTSSYVVLLRHIGIEGVVSLEIPSSPPQGMRRALIPIGYNASNAPYWFRHRRMVVLPSICNGSRVIMSLGSHAFMPWIERVVLAFVVLCSLKAP